MKISVVATVYNEEKTIRKLLDSLLTQTLQPTEIIITDGGSRDNTALIIKEYETKYKHINLIVSPGAISHGRNTSIKRAKNEIIAQIDAGCIAKKNWLEKITKPFEDKEVGLVAGFYEMKATTPLQKAAAVFHGIPKERFDPRWFLPSARSVAFRKKVWELVGGYSEKLDRAGEDTLFNYEVLRAGVKIYREEDAIVVWEVPKTYMESLKKFYSYAKGDAQAGIWWHPAQKLSTHNIKIAGIFGRYFIGFMLLVMAPQAPILFTFIILGVSFYLLWSIWKMKDLLSDTREKAWVPILQVTSDWAVMLGFAVGTLKK